MIGLKFILFSFIDNSFQMDCITLRCSEWTLEHSTVAGDTISQYYTDSRGKTGNSKLVKNYLTLYLHNDSLKKTLFYVFIKVYHCNYTYLQLKNYNHIQLLNFERKSKHSLIILVNKISVFNIISQKHFQTGTPP